MEQYPSYVDSKSSEDICELDKVLYGLKLGTHALVRNSMVWILKAQKMIHYCPFYKHGDVSIFMLVYVDDIIMVSCK